MKAPPMLKYELYVIQGADGRFYSGLQRVMMSLSEATFYSETEAFEAREVACSHAKSEATRTARDAEAAANAGLTAHDAVAAAEDAAKCAKAAAYAEAAKAPADADEVWFADSPEAAEAAYAVGDWAAAKATFITAVDAASAAHTHLDWIKESKVMRVECILHDTPTPAERAQEMYDEGWRARPDGSVIRETLDVPKDVWQALLERR